MTCIKKWSTDANQITRCFLLTIVIGIVLQFYSDGVFGNDFWWHVKVGEFICKNGYVPLKDIFSWIGMEKGIPWTAHEWLADVIFYKIFNSFGEVGIFSFSLGSAFLMIWLLWKEAGENAKKNVVISSLYFIAFAILAAAFFYGRPQLFSFFLLFLELKILYAYYEKNGSRAIWFLPLISLLWSNLHGGSSNLSYLLCGLFLFVGSFDFQFERIEGKKLSDKSRRTLFLVLLCTIGAIFVNPIGYRVFTYPYENMSDKLSMTMISEWQSPDAKIIGHLVMYFLPIALTSMGLMVGKGKNRLIDWLIMLTFVFLFLRSSRFIILWFISAPFYAFRYFPACRLKEIRGRLEKGLSLLLMVFLIAFAGHGIWKTSASLQKGNVIVKTLDDEAVEAIKADSPKRLFNDYNLGEALIYQDVPVFFDARADLFAKPGILGDGISIMTLRAATTNGDNVAIDLEDLIAKYDFDAFAILKARPLYVYLSSHPEKYRLVYEDENIGYFRMQTD